MHDVLVGFREIVKDFQQPQVAELMTRTLREGMESLSEAEVFQAMTCAQRVFRLWEEAFYLHQDGKLDERIWDGLQRQFASFLTTPPFAHAWKLRREFYGSDFRAVVGESPARDYLLR